jgi:GNAT superfamily N-acetyltransferase
MMVSAESSICAALEGNLWDLWSRFGRGEGCALHEQPHALWFDTLASHLPYNAVLRFTAGHDIERKIDALFEHYGRKGVPFLWLIHPTARPADLDERLKARGMEEAETCPGMFASLSDLRPPEQLPDSIEVKEVSDGTDLEALLELIAWRWSLPAELLPLLPGITRAFQIGVPGSGVKAWIARRHGVPVAKAVLNVAAGAAGVYGVATKPAARGLGLATALTLMAFHAARREGIELGVLHSTPMAKSLYERAGFRCVAPFRIFAPPSTLHV